MNFILNRPSQEWTAFLKDMNCSAYFQPEWFSVFKKTYGLDSWILEFRLDNKLVGGIPFAELKRLTKKTLVSMPFVYQGGMITTKEVNWEKLQNSLASLPFFDIKIRSTVECNLNKMCLDFDNSFFTFPLQENVDLVYKSLGHSARKNLRKSEGKKFKTKICQVELPSFYKVYTSRMKELGTPCHSFDFWKHILETFPDQANVIVVYDGNEPVAAMFFLIYQNVFHDILAISLSSYRQYCLFHFIHWEATRYAIEKKCVEFNFERSQNKSGGYEFKKQWGCKAHPLYYYSHSTQTISQTKNKFKFATKLWSLQPQVTANFIGPKLRKYIP